MAATLKAKRRGCAECRRLRRERAAYRAELERLRALFRTRLFGLISKVDAVTGEQREVENG